MSVVEDVRPADEDAPRYPVEFTTKARSYIGLVLLNLLLNIVTLTLYRFWGKTAIRRRLWAETSFAGDTFEYTGTGGELFKGFLIAFFAIFLPIVLIFGAAQAFLDPLLLPLIILPVYFLIGILALAALYFQRRYQLSRTLWRGIRFGLDGSAWSFAFFSLGQLLLTMVTFGWWGPTARQRMARRLWRNARYGNQKFSFYEGDNLAAGTYGPFAVGWIVAVLGYFVFIGVVVGLMFALGLNPATMGDFDPEAPESMSRLLPFIAAIYGGIFVYAFVVALAFLAYEAAAMRRTAELLSFGSTRFRINATMLSLLGLIFSNLLLLIFSLGLLYKVAEIRSWRYVIGRLEAVGVIDLSGVGQSEDRGPKSGEGLADGLDFGGI